MGSGDDASSGGRLSASGSPPIVRRLRGLLLYHDGPLLYFSRGYRLYRSEDGGRTARLIARLPRSTPREQLARTILGQRLVRGYIRHLRPWGGGVVLLAGKRFFRLMSGGRAEPGDFAVGSQPFHLAVTDRGIYYGEYRSNRERSPVAIYRSEDGLNFERVAELRGVRHIHGVFVDPVVSRSVLVATGDDDEESAIWRYDEESGEVERLLGGSQQLRAVTLVPTRSFIYFGSDTPRERNHIYRLHRESGKIEELAQVGGSVFWGRGLPDGSIAFSTVVEPSEVNPTRHAELWVARESGEFSLIRRWKADYLHPNLFQYSQVRFPAGPGEPGRLWVTPFANWAHQRSVALDLSAL